MLVKVLDGCAINGHFWVFSAAATDVEYTLTVKDRANGALFTHHHEGGSPAAALTALEAFATCGESPQRGGWRRQAGCGPELFGLRRTPPRAVTAVKAAPSERRGRHGEQVRRNPSAIARAPRRVLGRGGGGDLLGAAFRAGARRQPAALLPVVSGRPAQYLLQRASTATSSRAAALSQPSIYDSPVTATVQSFCYAELQDAVARLAGGLLRIGVRAGDRVLIYMPMVPEAVFGMLACARIGAIHSVVFGGFAPRELAKRIDDALPVAILTASCGIEVQRVIPYLPLLEQAIALASHTPQKVVVLARPQQPAELRPGRDLDWRRAGSAAPCPPSRRRCRRPIRSTSSTPRAPPGCPKASCATPAATRWRLPGAWKTFTAWPRAK